MLEAPTVLLLMGIALIVFIVAGLHIYVVLGMVSLVGTYLLFGDVGITLELASLCGDPSFCAYGRIHEQGWNGH